MPQEDKIHQQRVTDELKISVESSGISIRKAVNLIIVGNLLFTVILYFILAWIFPEANPWAGIYYFFPISLATCFLFFTGFYWFMKLFYKLATNPRDVALRQKQKAELLLKQAEAPPKLSKPAVTLLNLASYSVLILNTIIFSIGAPFIYTFYFMAFDAPGSYEDRNYFYTVTAAFALPYVTLVAGWIFYFFRRYLLTFLLAIAPWMMFLTLYIMANF